MSIPIDAYVIICGNVSEKQEIVYPTTTVDMSEDEMKRTQIYGWGNCITIGLDGSTNISKKEIYCFDYKDVEKYIEKNLLNKYKNFLILKVREQLEMTQKSIVTKDKRTLAR